MKPSEIRDTLLEQHVALRKLLEEVRSSTERWRSDASAGEEARGCLARLAAALRRHNACEEELLRGVIRAVDAWGPARAEIMDEEHVKEHRELHAALSAAAAGKDTALTLRLVSDLRERLLQHMEREEQGFLGADVLRDDAVLIDSFGG